MSTNSPTRVLVSTFPFAESTTEPLDALLNAGFDVTLNPYDRKLTAAELVELLPEFDALIAGTETISEKALTSSSRLRIISRVGVGLDSVNLHAARRQGIRVCYTPEAPVAAVAELTVGLMINVIRQISQADIQLHEGHWHRHFGRRIGDSVVGLIGAGRIGGRVLDLLTPFQPKRILVNDLVVRDDIRKHPHVEIVEKMTIYSEADIITLHTPLTRSTKHMIGYAELIRMKPTAFLINTARGGIVKEDDLVRVLAEGHLAGVAIDVFENEPYSGPLTNSRRCVLTSHMGSMSIDCRNRMELEATQEVIRHFSGQPLLQEVPESEFRTDLLG